MAAFAVPFAVWIEVNPLEACMPVDEMVAYALGKAVTQTSRANILMLRFIVCGMNSADTSVPRIPSHFVAHAT